MATKVELGPSCAAAPGVLDRGTFSPRALDLFCGAGGVSVGLQRAGFEVTGVDIKEQPNYRGGTFVLGDALTFPLDGFDFVWASPPCQAYTAYRRRPGHVGRFPDLIAAVRERLQSSDAEWVIENVTGAPLRYTKTLCGSMFGLDVRRHRIFESSFFMPQPPCRHKEQAPRFPPATNRTNLRRTVEIGVWRIPLDVQRRAMGIDWMTREELSQAIPPTYAQFIGEQAIASLREKAH
jgi:DNA (cytosine-5)-methyltransferase 1